MTSSLANVVAGGLTALALTAPVVGQDAAKPDEPAAAATQATESGSGHGRHDRHQSAASSKSDGAAKNEVAGKADTAAKTDTSSAGAGAKDDQPVCRTLKPTGSRVPKKVCATAATWAEVDARGKRGAQDFMKEMGDQGRSAPPPTGIANPL